MTMDLDLGALAVTFSENMVDFFFPPSDCCSFLLSRLSRFVIVHWNRRHKIGVWLGHLLCDLLAVGNKRCDITGQWRPRLCRLLLLFDGRNHDINTWQHQEKLVFFFLVRWFCFVFSKSFFLDYFSHSCFRISCFFFHEILFWFFFFYVFISLFVTYFFTAFKLIPVCLSMA